MKILNYLTNLIEKNYCIFYFLLLFSFRFLLDDHKSRYYCYSNKISS